MYTPLIRSEADQAAIDHTIAVFFRAFDNRNGKTPDLESLRTVLLPQAQIISQSLAQHKVYGVDDFIAPRAALLSDGRLVEFAEYEVAARTQISGGIAQRLCLYRKAGVMNGVAFVAHGLKSFQLIKLGAEWKIAACAWEDEQPHFDPQAVWAATVQS